MKGGRRSSRVGFQEADVLSASDADPATAGEHGGGTDSFVQDIPAAVDPRRSGAERQVTS